MIFQKQKTAKRVVYSWIFNKISILHAFQAICSIFKNLTFLTFVTFNCIQGHPKLVERQIHKLTDMCWQKNNIKLMKKSCIFSFSSWRTKQSSQIWLSPVWDISKTKKRPKEWFTVEFSIKYQFSMRFRQFAAFSKIWPFWPLWPSTAFKVTQS